MMSDQKLDVQFVAEDHRPGWLGYGAGLACGIWTALVTLCWLIENLAWWGLLLWPLVWAFGFILLSQLIFGLGSGMAALLNGAGQRRERFFSELLLLVGLCGLACHLILGHQTFQRWLGWSWWIILGIGFLAEMGVKRWRRSTQTPDMNQMARSSEADHCT